jgi:hypothetical protein
VTPVLKLAAFLGVLAVVFGGAALAGAAIGPERDDAAPEGHGEMAAEPHGEAAGTHGEAADPVRGLAIADDGLRVVVEDPDLPRGREQTLRFRIVDEHGETVRDFAVEHERRMHLILARRDLTGFQHLHPEQAADGSWSTPVRIDAAGSYRLFADFAHDGEAQTLASDLRVDGAADLQALPAPAATAVSDGGYDVRLDAGDAGPGEEADLDFTITRNGRPIRTEPYLGAGGHLVALREGDLAFLHVHPLAEDSVRFAATFPTAGRYRLFLQFQYDGRVHTVAFTHEVR